MRWRRRGSTLKAWRGETFKFVEDLAALMTQCSVGRFMNSNESTFLFSRVFDFRIRGFQNFIRVAHEKLVIISETSDSVSYCFQNWNYCNVLDVGLI